eukprot:15331791-Ditylum_brightwellii.AAC.2
MCLYGMGPGIQFFKQQLPRHLDKLVQDIKGATQELHGRIQDRAGQNALGKETCVGAKYRRQLSPSHNTASNSSSNRFTPLDMDMGTPQDNKSSSDNNDSKEEESVSSRDSSLMDSIHEYFKIKALRKKHQDLMVTIDQLLSLGHNTNHIKLFLDMRTELAQPPP